MKRLINQLKSNKGSGIVTVLVAVLFLSAFGTLSLYLAYTSTEMVTSERKGREATYNAETCMEEIKAGLQITVSDAIAKSYNEIMPRYTSYNKDISDEFNKLYLDSVLGAKVINYNGTVNPEDDDDEESNDSVAHKIVYFDGNLFNIEKQADGKYKPSGTYDCTQLARLVEETRNGTCRVFSGSSDNTAGILQLTDTEIIIKDITVSYETGGRKSSVTSDISIGIPDLGYLMTQYAISGIPDFSLICKGTLHQDEENGKTARIFGSAYADGINLEKDSQLILGNGGTFIVKNAVDLAGNATGERFTTNANTSLWARDINVYNSTNAKLAGKTYVENDLKFLGTSSSVQLGGKDEDGHSFGTYYGFGCDASDPSKSSSIIFNHATEETNKNNLDISNLTDLVLSGVSFVSNSNRFGLSSPSRINEAAGLFDDDDTTMPGSSVTTDRIGARTGMSIDAKFNQVIYFAPKGEVTPYLLRTGEFDVGGEMKTLIYMNRTDDDGTNYFADYNNGNPIFYKSSDSGLVSATGVEYDPQVTAGTLETDADGITFYKEADLNKVAYFALNGEQYEYNSAKKEFVLSQPSSASFPAEIFPPVPNREPPTYSDYAITLQPIYEYLSGGSDGSGGVYEITFFMKFNDTVDPATNKVTVDAQEHANQFFLDYFNASNDNKQKIIDNIDDYTNIITSSITSRRTVGNTIGGSDSNNYSIIQALSAAFNSIRAEAETIGNIFNQFCIGLASKIDAENLDPDPTKRNPYDFYIDETKIFTDLPLPNSELRFYNNEGFTGLIFRGDFTYTSTSVYSDLHILIATGDVHVKGTFNGLIIAGGNIYLDDNCTLNKYAEGVANAYNADTIDGEHVHDSTQTINNIPDRILKDYFKMDISKEFMYSSSRSGDAWNVEGLVTYKNWHR